MKTDIRTVIKNLIQEMSRGAYEREEVIALSLLSAFAGESIFLLGLPGVGKSMVARRLKSAFKDSTCFEYLMSRFSTPDEIFGPVSITKLKDGDTYERCIDGYLPTADVIFLDEIWKAGPAIQNSLLTALNEKIFHNGKNDIKLPLKGIIAASNELPAEDEGLEALWDRFLIRYIVQPVSEKNAFMSLVCDTENTFCMPSTLPVNSEDFDKIQMEIKKVTVPDSILASLFSLRSLYSKRFMNKEELSDDEEITAPYVSDRRWKKIVGILRASAYLNGRDKVDASDCLLLEHLLWDKDNQISVVKKDVAGMVSDCIMKTYRSGEEGGIVFDEVTTSENIRCYTILAGRDDLLIPVEDYERLQDGKPTYGRFCYGNLIRVDEKQGDFRLKYEAPGAIIMNAFKYQIKRKPSRRTTSVEQMGNIPDMLTDQIASNMFLRDNLEHYPYLKAMSNRFRGLTK